MKDKLEKHHKRRNYYARKKFAIIFAIVFGLFATAAVPASIVICNQVQIHNLNK